MDKYPKHSLWGYNRMTLPLDKISFSKINTELSRSSSARFDIDDAEGRKLASAGPTGQSLTTKTPVKLSNFLGHSRANIIISSDTAVGCDILTLAKGISYSVSKSYVTMTVNSGIYVGSPVVTSPAVAVSGFGSGDIVEIKNYGTIIGAGGDGGAGGFGGQGATPGYDGGTAISASQYVSVLNSGTLAGGGGGGGGNTGYSQQQGFLGQVARYPGSGGGGGAGYNAGAGGDTNAQSGTKTLGGTGYNSAGSGGGPGQSGTGSYSIGEARALAPGNSGYYINGSTYVTLTGNLGLGRIV